MFELSWPWIWIALPLPILLYYVLGRKVKSHTEPVLFAPNLAQLGTQAQVQGNRSKRRIWLATLLWLALLLAASRPAWVGEPITLQSSGRQIMLAVDLSGSMETKDMQLDGKPANRLAIVKNVLNPFIAERKGDELGLVLFANHAYLQAPLTYDIQTVQTFLDQAQIGLVGTQTAIGEGIGLALKRMLESKAKQRVLILLTDGQNNAGNVSPLDAAKFAKRHHVTIYTIGIGADTMVQQTFFGARRVPVSNDLDSRTLEAIAKATGGKYFRAKSSKAILNAYQTINRLEPVDTQKRTYRPKSELYPWPLTLALLLCLFLIADPKRGILRE